MKRAGRILSLVLVLVMMMTAFCYAATETFDLKESYPKDGSKGASVENLGVKLYFEGATFTEETLKNTNDHAFQLLDEEGTRLPIRVLYAPKEEGVVLVLLDTTAAEEKEITVEGNKFYSLKIADTLKDDSGKVYGQSKEIRFRTMNTSMNMLINMGLMTVMMGGMMFFTMKSAQKQASEQAQKQREEKMNPYKEAKRTGKSVEEIIAQNEKEKAKKAEKAAKKAAREGEDFHFEYSVNYRVKKARPISEAGSTYVTGRKALAEAKRAEEEAKKAKKAAYEAKAKKKKHK